MQGEGVGQGRRSWFSWLGLLAVLLLTVQAARSAFVAAQGERRAALAHTIWPSHPLPQVTLALAEIGAAAREGKQPGQGTLELVRSAGRVDPLGVEPLLIAATARLAVGDREQGERLLKAALHREPRSTAAHFLLADLYVRQQRIGDALVHVGVLGRRIRGGGAEPFAAALAVYLRDPARVAAVRPTLTANAALRYSVLLNLAQDPAAATSLRALTRRGDANENWFRIAFERNLAAGNVGEARALLGAAGVGGGGALTPWATSDDAGPLSWSFPATPEGVAEPVSGGPLRLVYYGRADASLAAHLLLLPPGRYRFAAQFAGAVPPGSFEWRVTCVQGARQIVTLPVTSPASVQAFDVGPDCPAQRLALWGRMGEFPRTVDAELARVSLSSVEVQR
jgi:hypothetical protein